MADFNISPTETGLFLKTVPLLAGLSENALLSIARVCSLKRIQCGQVLFRRGDAPEAVYLVKSGVVVEFAGGPNELEMIVKARRRGDYFGEMGILVDEPSLVTAIATQAGTLVVIPKQEFLTLVWSQPSMMKYIIKTLIHRLKMSSEKQISFAMMDAHARLAYVLLWLEQEEGKSGFITTTQEDIASCCGLVRQTVAKILGEWRRLGLINTLHKKIVLIDRAALVQVMLEEKS